MQNKNPTKAEKTLAKIAKVVGQIQRAAKEIKEVWRKDGNDGGYNTEEKAEHQ